MQLSAFSLPFQTHGVRGCKHFFAVYISSCLRNTNIYKLFYAPKSPRKTTHRDALLRNVGMDSHYILSRWVRLFFSDSKFEQRQIKNFNKKFPGRAPTDSNTPLTGRCASRSTCGAAAVTCAVTFSLTKSRALNRRSRCMNFI